MILILVIIICIYNLYNLHLNYMAEKALRELAEKVPGLHLSCVRGKHLFVMVPIKTWCSSNGEIMDHTGRPLLTNGKYCHPKCPQKYGKECIHFRKDGYPSLPLEAEGEEYLRCNRCIEVSFNEPKKK